MAIEDIMRDSSGIAIKQGFERVIKKHIPKESLIGQRNFYLKDTALRMDSATVASLKKNQIEEYIASSVLVHCTDGWNYLSRSIESLINGDIASSIHFAYYAELRSAMSLMAFEGVGVFNKKHIWFDTHKSASLFGGFTTHSLVNSGMEAWAGLSTKKNILFDLVKVKNRSLDNWIRESGVSTNSKYANSVINKWLKRWSVDLHLKRDQFIRNEMSYRPHYLTAQIDIGNLLTKLTEVWELLEPSPSSGFLHLDQHLLRIALEGIYRKSKGAKPVGPNYAKYVESIFNRLGEDTEQTLFNFLLRRSNPEDALIFIEAKKDNLNSDNNKKDPFPLICRAILLLRLSTGAANNLIETSSINKESLRFWWEKLSHDQGVINSIGSEINPTDLFTDIRDSITEINSIGGGLTNIKDSFDLASGALYYLKQFQRPAIWGMGL
ncbi:hypothetical protein H9Q13_04175 [Pontibacter sp. JH31]|uniref:Uncharacterized protein n=1 Tax=Pontibacter aquaedesilientis TaxID=2766980 RepID=A0ABR7XDH4_9BACT|nr:hypothetical protein [Pontibacter aquaedesilientis]MBD1396350.1 hypothetical protein [Pontibacter aquaedesilientis]